ncbi:hypothetical protein ACIBG4_06225 [Nonomuraea sp. NPDC050383]|uniref:hypothetical protein n=1 Tax=Nonomuraea sp. NPDC050383 TaxID=3364362 RepID=UPI0037990365
MHPHLEAIFDQPDLIPPGNWPRDEATIISATATRTGKQWTAAAKLPDGRPVKAQGATWVEVKKNVAQLIFDCLQAEPGALGVHLAPADSEAAAALDAVVSARIARANAEQAERDAVRHAAHLLISQGWTTRDAGSALRLSHQRISQITSSATE